MTLAAVQALIFTACMDEFESPPEKKIIREEATVTVNEAKACFEDQMMWMEGVVDGKELKGWATNFTPQWDNAVISKSESKGMAAVDVPIIADFSFRAVIYDPTNPKKKIFNEKMVQKLVVAKDLKTGRLCSYVASIIPDKDYALSKNRKLSAMDFANYSDYGNFSGMDNLFFSLIV